MEKNTEEKQENGNKEKIVTIEGILTALHLNLTLPLLIAYAVLLGAETFQVAALVTAGAVSSMLGGLPSAWIIEKTNAIKKSYLLSYFLAGTGWLFIALIPFLTQNWFPFLLAAYAWTGFMASFSLIAWTTWMGNTFPKKRGTIFSRRNYLVAVFALIALLFSNLFLGSFSGEKITGFQVLFAGSVFFSFLAAAAMARLPEKKVPVLVEKNHFFRIIRYVAEEKGFKQYVLFMFVFNLGLWLTGAFFDVYALNVLKIGAEWIPAFAFGLGLGTIITMRAWGTLIDRHGSKTVLVISSFGVSLTPLFWVFIHEPMHFFAVAVLSGLFLNGFMLSSFNYQLDLTPATKRAKYLALFSFMTGIPVVIAPFLAYGILQVFSFSPLGLGPFLWLFLVSTGTRLSAAFVAGMLKEPRQHRIRAKAVFGDLVFETAGYWQSTAYNLVHIPNLNEIKKIFLARIKRRLESEKRLTSFALKKMRFPGKSPKLFYYKYFTLLSLYKSLLKAGKKMSSQKEQRLVESKNFFRAIKSAQRKANLLKEFRKAAEKKA